MAKSHLAQKVVAHLIVGCYLLLSAMIFARILEIKSQQLLEDSYEGFQQAGICYGDLGKKIKC